MLSPSVLSQSYRCCGVPPPGNVVFSPPFLCGPLHRQPQGTLLLDRTGCSPGLQASCQVLGEARKLELCWASCHCGFQAKPCLSLSYQGSPPILPWYPWVVILEGQGKQGLLFSVLGTEPKGLVHVRQALCLVLEDLSGLRMWLHR